MNPTVSPDSLARLEARLRRITVLFGLALLALLVVLLGLARITLTRPDVLRLRTLSIVDNRGVERVRVAGQLPDAVVNGKQVPRGDEAAGVLIYDDAGQERGGYVTFERSRSAALTLDTREGMVVLLTADSIDGAALRLWGRGFADWVDLRTGSVGARLSVGRDHQVVLQQPAMSEVELGAACGELKEELSRLDVQPPVDDVLRACKQHMTDAACRRCLEIR